MEIHDNTEQGSEQWEKWRDVRATASEFGKIFTGGGKISGQREAYMRSRAVARQYNLPKSFIGNQWTDRGHELEPVARQLFIFLSGLNVRTVACIEHENGLCGGSPDGIIESADGRDISGLEIKCYNYDKHIGICTKKELPTDCKPQVHGLLWLTGFSSWQFMAYHDEAMPFDHVVVEVAPDQYTADLGGEVLAFCEELDSRAEEFISDFEKSTQGIAMREAMPILFGMLGESDDDLI